MLDRKNSAIDWLNVVWLLFIVGLALLPPLDEIHKQMILAAFALVQYFEGRLVSRFPIAGQTASVEGERENTSLNSNTICLIRPSV